MKFFIESSQPIGQGCMNIELACDRFLSKRGLGRVGRYVCPHFYMGGRLCVQADAMVGGRCRSGGQWSRHWYVHRYRCRCGWRGCRTCYTWRYRWVWKPVYKNFQMMTRIGLFGELYGGVNVRIAALHANAKVMWFHTTENPHRMGSLKGQMGGSHVGVYVEYRGWVGWSRFSDSITAVPWGGDNTCPSKSEMNGESFLRVSREADPESRPESIAGYYPSQAGLVWSGLNLYGDRQAGDCQAEAKQRGYEVWGHRTVNHPSKHYRNSCFFFRYDGRTPLRNGPLAPDYHSMGCANNKKLSTGCK